MLDSVRMRPPPVPAASNSTSIRKRASSFFSRNAPQRQSSFLERWKSASLVDLKGALSGSGNGNNSGNKTSTLPRKRSQPLPTHEFFHAPLQRSNSSLADMSQTASINRGHLRSGSSWKNLTSFGLAEGLFLII